MKIQKKKKERKNKTNNNNSSVCRREKEDCTNSTKGNKSKGNTSKRLNRREINQSDQNFSRHTRVNYLALASWQNPDCRMCPNPATVTCKAVDGNKGTKKGVCRYNNEGVLYMCSGADCMDMKVSGSCPPGERRLPRVNFSGLEG